MGGRHQSIHRQQSEGRRGVDDDGVEGIFEALYGVFEPVGRVELADDIDFELCHSNT